MQTETFSAMAAVRALRNQLLAQLEQNEDFRLLRGLEFVLAQEANWAERHAPNGKTVQTGAPARQNEKTAPPSPSSVIREDDSLHFSQVSKAS